MFHHFLTMAQWINLMNSVISQKQEMSQAFNIDKKV
ncbi:hypothetical protein VAA_03452 [Vibrio anguillarum 775]|nr:hypothetical protein VAA_03452 [Vibrio anguillarum 775]